MEVLLRMRRLDFLSPHVNFTVAGDSGIKTMFGMVMTVLYAVSITIFGYLILLTFFSTLDPSISQEYSEGEKYARVDLAKESFVPVMYLYEGPYPVAASEYLKYITPVFIKYRFKQVKAADGSSTTEIFVKTMSVVPCAILSEEARKYYTQYNDSTFFKAYAIPNGLCVEIDPEEYFVAGGGTEPSVDIMNYAIYPCSLPSGCVSKERLREVSMIFATPSFSSNYSNSHNPIKSFLNADNFYYINDKMLQKYQYKFMSNEVYDDRGMMFEKSLRTSYSSIDKTITNARFRVEGDTECPGFNMNTCKEYFNFEFMSSSRKLKVFRTYKGITKTMSEMGGINSICLLVFLYLNILHLYFKKKGILSEKIFSISHSAAKLTDSVLVVDTENKDYKIKKCKSIETRLKNMKSNAEEMVREGLDVVGIVREMSTVKVISNLLFKDYHHTLTPLVALNISQSGHTDRGRGGDDLHWAVSELKKRFDQVSMIPVDKQSLEDKIDVVYWNVLSGEYSNQCDSIDNGCSINRRYKSDVEPKIHPSQSVMQELRSPLQPSLVRRPLSVVPQKRMKSIMKKVRQKGEAKIDIQTKAVNIKDNNGDDKI